MNVNTKNLVVIYEHANYQGENQSLSEGKYNLADINIGNDKLSSIRIPYGIKVTLFEHINFRGRRKTFTTNTKYVGDDFNDLTSSLTIEKQKICTGHGNIGNCATTAEERELESPFSRLFDRSDLTYNAHAISLLAGALGPMQESPTNNSFKPSIQAGFTFLGQFIDHDMTEFRVLDEEGKFVDKNPTIGVRQRVAPEENPTSTNGRSSRLDLDSVYGLFGETNPELFDDNGFFILGDARRSNGKGERDIQRNTDFGDGRRIADPRNDENKIIVQLHTLFMRLHNKIHANNGGDIKSPGFTESKKTVQQIYRQIVFCDYLPRIVTTKVINNVKQAIKEGKSFYQQMNREVNRALESEKPLVAMPVEFAHAVFRLGHSQLLDFYRLNTNNVFPLFATSLTGQQTDLRGNEQITEETEIDWSFFFGERAQLGRPLDTKLPPSVFRLPPPAITEPPISLAERNILRGIDFGLPGGQEVAVSLRQLYGQIELVPPQFLGIPKDISEIEPSLEVNTPLWYYILKEAEVLNLQNSQLGEVGGYIVAETILGSLAESGFEFNISCPNSLEKSANINNPKEIFSLVNLLSFLGEIN